MKEELNVVKVEPLLQKSADRFVIFPIRDDEVSEIELEFPDCLC